MGFNPSILKKQMTERSSFWCMLQVGPPSLHYYCAVVLRSCTVLPPVGHSSYHEYHYCQLTRQVSCISNFSRGLRFSFESPSYNVTLRHVRATIVAVEKQRVLHNLSVCICSLRYPACSAHAPYSHLWPAGSKAFFNITS
jgi:hypothetical protein